MNYVIDIPKERAVSAGVDMEVFASFFPSCIHTDDCLKLKEWSSKLELSPSLMELWQLLTPFDGLCLYLYISYHIWKLQSCIVWFQ